MEEVRVWWFVWGALSTCWVLDPINHAPKQNINMNRPKLQLVVRPPPSCDRCGEVISSGTYGIIYQDRRDPLAVIKGSIKPTDPRADRCPELFMHEYAMSMIVQELVHMYMELYGTLRRCAPCSLGNRLLYP